MSTFHLQIVTPDGLFFDGQAQRLSVRATTGDLTILPRHIDFVAALGMGQARVCVDDTVRKAACIGGMLRVQNGDVRLLATTFEWAEDIDFARAERAKETAENRLQNRTSMAKDDVRLAEAKLRRALVRIGLREK
ncbi:MAG: ATP synthase F1 subunit epsilon [Oscillospiraceae bacterium]|nr:ATP synthase F1 subunit epsilon [Oscillospiraceae bacterium]MBQ5749214.1 ATP synthase F1 subunit epsilon [Oscillospiraceae bacterium]